MFGDNEPIDVSGYEVTDVEQNKNIITTKTDYTTALHVQKKRERKNVLAACLEEAGIAGGEFYYSWTVTSKSGKKTLVEGLSIQAALACARNWGNCACPVQVEDTVDSYLFTAAFLDLETGFNLQRIFRQRKKVDLGSKMDAGRSDDIVFQIGQSKAIRNVVLNALPSWLTSKVLVKAKEQIVARIQKMGVPVAKEKTLEFFERRGVSVERIESKLEKKAHGWQAEELAILQGCMNALVNGQETEESLFPENVDTGNSAENLEARRKDTKQPESDSEDKAIYGLRAELKTKYQGLNDSQRRQVLTHLHPDDAQRTKLMTNNLTEEQLKSAVSFMRELSSGEDEPEDREPGAEG